MRSDFYPNFNVLRLILALSVVFEHYWGDLLGLDMPYVPYAAVPAFLCISGFVVLASFERSHGWLHFAYKRLLRVGPAFVLALVLTGVLLGMSAVGHSIACWATFGIGDKGVAGDAPLWSLSWEEVCYIALATIFLAGGYRRPAVIWGLLAVSLVAALTIREHDAALLCRILPIVPSFFCGNLCYLYRERLRSVTPKVPAYCFVLAAASLVYRTTNVDITVLHCIAAAVIGVWFCIAGPQLPIRLLGDYSYGIYVYHYPIIHMALILYRHDHVADFWTVTIFTGAMAYLSWTFVESRFLLLKDKPLFARKGSVIEAAAETPNKSAAEKIKTGV